MTMCLDVGVCTFRRLHLVETLRSLRRVRVPNGLSMRIVVIDNDDIPSAAEQVRVVGTEPGAAINYVHAPGRNIAIARNALLARTDADWIGFVDDDETVVPVWLEALWTCAQNTGADAVFGSLIAVFPPGTPQWMIDLDIHAPGAQRCRSGRVETGNSGNVLLRWRGTPWQDQRFDLTRGRTGGEDTEFFFRLGRMGANYDIAPDAVAYEPVAPDRLSLRWLLRRRYRAGQSYAAGALRPTDRIALAAKAAAKSGWSLAMVLPRLPSPAGWRFWLLRAQFHAGVVAGCLSLPQSEHYG